MRWGETDIECQYVEKLHGLSDVCLELIIVGEWVGIEVRKDLCQIILDWFECQINWHEVYVVEYKPFSVRDKGGRWVFEKRWLS